MRTYTPKEVIRLLEQHDFVLSRSRGSHHIYRHPDGRKVIVPFHNKDLPKGTLMSIIKQSGIPRKTF
ncbi:MAG: type II toxin-antitoxin system HicA family toxin [Bacteroidota bacterium]